ncbi:MAG: nucleotidyl transferase AbiEii/AbiGii toxin family protein [Zoogloeaceae bacterium]|nr:nucleotidyl transferase AbiEii/AbiGii toxin family protein [Zoogloeaceae bacterium]MCK6383231.1 nucleotidyl transferase AbiEii/AbiGii toxin family protein [Rhodocyclaceae bacterium]
MPALSLKIDPVQRIALQAVDAAARAARADWFVAGATARDWLLQDIHGIETLRATKDVDFGIAVRDWDAFRRIRETISAGGEFAQDPRADHRLNHRRVAGFHIDLVPFGPLAGADGEIAWPPDRSIVMNVTGFDEAFDAAVQVAIDEGFVVRVASLPGLMLMKLFAWRDRRHEAMHKDAWDLRLLLTQYERAGNADRIFDEGAMKAEGFDAACAAARLLGRDVAGLLRPRSRAALLSLLDAELNDPDSSELVEQVAHASAAGRPTQGDLDGGLRVAEVLKWLSCFRAGLDD